MPAARSVYRQLLKTVAKHVPDGKAWFAHIRPLFLRSTHPDDRSAHLQAAQDYCFLVNNIHHHQV